MVKSWRFRVQVVIKNASWSQFCNGEVKMMKNYNICKHGTMLLIAIFLLGILWADLNQQGFWLW